MFNKLQKSEKGFTGLEAAIVLVAFVVVAAVFSYVMLGAGFYTTQKSQEVVHTGVKQASSSVELSGDVMARGDDGLTEIDSVTLFLQLTSGGSAVDMNKTLIVVSASDISPVDLKLGATANAVNFAIADKFNDNDDELIDRFEKFEITINLNAIGGAASITPNDQFQLEIKPPQGASYTIQRQAPPSIGAIMTLV